MSTTIEGRPADAVNQPAGDQVVLLLQQRAVFGETQRYRLLDRRESFFRCMQYAHQDRDWEGRNADDYETISPEVVFPKGTGASSAIDGLLARDKRPTAPTNIVRRTVKRYTGLMFSEKRCPKVRVANDPDTESFLEAVREAAGFWAAMRAARNKGGSMGSVVVTVGCRDGEFDFEVHNSKNVTPVWNDRKKLKLAGILVMERYLREVNVVAEDGKVEGTEVVVFLSRRIITEQVDVVYEDVRADAAFESGWTVQSQVKHGLGVFPGVWIQNDAESDDQDGDADCEGAWQMVDADDRLLAEIHAGTMNNLDPTLVTKTDPTEVSQLGPGQSLQKGSGNGLEVGSKGDAKFLEMAGAGIEVGLKVSDKYEEKIDALTGMVQIDDADMAAAQSAKAIEFRFASMLERADDLRVQYGRAVIQLMRLTEQIARNFMGTTLQLVTPDGGRAVGKFRFDLPPRELDGELVDHQLGPGGYISLKWGPYFAPTAFDVQQEITNSAKAAAAGFVRKVTAARPIAESFGIQDVEGEVKAATDEASAEDEQRLSMAIGRPSMFGGGSGGSPAAGGGGRP